MFEFIINSGYALIETMSKLFGIFRTRLSDLLIHVNIDVSSVPLIGDILSYSIFDYMVGIGLPTFLIYTLIKWILP